MSNIVNAMDEDGNVRELSEEEFQQGRPIWQGDPHVWNLYLHSLSPEEREKALAEASAHKASAAE